jgi:hypothetical protein
MKTKISFNKMTAAQKRVAVCKDAIAQTNAGILKWESMTYLIVNGEIKSNQETFIRAKRCVACAIGAALCSLVRIDNKFEYKDNTPPAQPMKERLQDVFSENQLKLIEAAFERDIEFAYGVPYVKKAVKFGQSFVGNRNRGVAIFRNIIANKGTFKP